MIFLRMISLHNVLVKSALGEYKCDVGMSVENVVLMDSKLNSEDYGVRKY
jgi:hypothetical protein